MNELEAFAEQLSGLDGIRQVDLAVALIWYHDLKDSGSSVAVKDLANLLHTSSLCGKVNGSRLSQQLSKNRDVVRGHSPMTFKLKAASRIKLDEQYSVLVGTKRIKLSDSIVPRDPFINRRKCWQEMVIEINGCYDHVFYDGCAVMCRRLMVSLLIELFKARKAESEITKKDGSGFEMLERIIDVVNNGRIVKLSRSSKPTLDPIKRIGDIAAHSPHHITTKQDMDGIANHVRVIVSELLYLIDEK